MLKVLCLLMGLGCPMVAQPPIWQTVFTNQTTTGVSSNVKNSGQTQHILYGTISSNSPSTCTNPFQSIIRLEGSYDNSTFTAISLNAVAESVDNNNAIWYVFGNGSYPFIRARIVYLSVSGGAASCKANVYYSGTFPTVPIQGSVMSKGFSSLVVTDTITGPGPQLGINGANSNGKFVVNFADLNVNGAGILVLQEYTDNSCTTTVSGVSIMWANNFPTAGSKQFPYMDSGYYKAKQNGSSLCVSFSGATGSFLFKYRYEE